MHAYAVLTVAGHEAIEAVVATARRKFHGYVVQLITKVDNHHHIARFSCEVTLPDRSHRGLIVSGVAVAERDSRLQHVYEYLRYRVAPAG